MTRVRVEIVFATPTQVHRDHVEAEAGITLEAAIRRSALAWALEESARIGVFGQIRSPSEPALDGDRIEIYRGLVADPKAARRRRAAQRPLKGGAYPG